MVGSILRIQYMMWLGMRVMSESFPFLYGEWGGGADGRNQVIAGCGNGSLRLFDLTLEVGPTLSYSLEGWMAVKLIIRAYQRKYGMNIPPRFIR